MCGEAVSLLKDSDCLPLCFFYFVQQIFKKQQRDKRKQSESADFLFFTGHGNKISLIIHHLTVLNFAYTTRIRGLLTVLKTKFWFIAVSKGCDNISALLQSYGHVVTVRSKQVDGLYIYQGRGL